MDFPPELERRIFWFAMRSDPSIVPVLKLVAHRVGIWAGEILHEHVLLDEWNRSEEDVKNGLGPVPGKDQIYAGQFSEFAKNVSSLCLTYNHELSAEQLKLFASCRGISRLALWVDYLERPQITAILITLHLRQLSLEVEHFLRLPTPLTPACVWTSQLTHLELIFWSSTTDLEEMSFRHLPCLQHLCLVWGARTYPWTVTAALTTSCHPLRTLVILTASGKWAELDGYVDLPEAKGVRIVLLPSLRQATYEWIPGGTTVWERVQDHLALQSAT